MTDIVLVSKSAWEPPIRREHALARLAGAHGHRVTFIERPLDIRALGGPHRGAWARSLAWRPSGHPAAHRQHAPGSGSHGRNRRGAAQHSGSCASQPGGGGTRRGDAPHAAALHHTRRDDRRDDAVAVACGLRRPRLPSGPRRRRRLGDSDPGRGAARTRFIRSGGPRGGRDRRRLRDAARAVSDRSGGGRAQCRRRSPVGSSAQLAARGASDSSMWERSPSALTRRWWASCSTCCRIGRLSSTARVRMPGSVKARARS